MKVALFALCSLCTLTHGCWPTFALAKEIKIADSVKLADNLTASAGGAGATRIASLPQGKNLPATKPKVAGSSPIKVEALLGTPYVLAGQSQTTYLKVGLEGLAHANRQRPPVNVAIVLDKSSSMAGDKMREAKRAAVMAVNALSAQDIVSVVTYDSTVSVIVGATRVVDKDRIATAIDRVEATGSTALFAGVSRGAAELRTFLSRNRVNRIILLSDGMANIGPSSPGELATLGASLAREGMSVTTVGLGLGYNEDLMLKLAMASDGNHAFVENAHELAEIFAYELTDVLAVVASDVEVDITLTRGFEPVRVLGRDAFIEGQVVRTRINQVLNGHQKYIIIEVAVPAMSAGPKRLLGEVAVSYNDLASHERGKRVRRVDVRTTTAARVVEEKTNSQVMVTAVEMLANERNKVALELRDQGKHREAIKVLEDNQVFLRKTNKRYRSKRLDRIIDFNDETVSPNLAPEKSPAQWNRARKQMREEQFEIDTQQSMH